MRPAITMATMKSVQTPAIPRRQIHRAVLSRPTCWVGKDGPRPRIHQIHTKMVEEPPRTVLANALCKILRLLVGEPSIHPSSISLHYNIIYPAHLAILDRKRIALHRQVANLEIQPASQLNPKSYLPICWQGRQGRQGRQHDGSVYSSMWLPLEQGFVSLILHVKHPDIEDGS